MTLTRGPLTRANDRDRCSTCGKPVKIIDLYCRISEDYDGDGGMRSVDDQEADGRFEIAEAGCCCYRVGEVFKDPDLSGWKKNVKRPDFEKVMARLNARESDGLWVYDISRFTRKPKEGEPLIELAEQGLIVLSGDSEYDLTSPKGKVEFRNALTQAAYESDIIQKRTRRGKRLKAGKGKSNASFRGFARDGISSRPEDVAHLPKGAPRPMIPRDVLLAEQVMIRDVVTRMLAREPAERCAADMTAAGFRTINGKIWSPGALKQMLKSPSLCGLIEHDGKIVPGKRLPGEHALTERQWFDLMELFKSRSRGVPADVYLLSSIARCGRCGAVLYGRPEPAKRGLYTEGEFAGQPKRSYFCQPVKRQNLKVPRGCARLSIDWLFLDQAVKEGVLAKLGDSRNVERLMRDAERGQEQRGLIQVELDRRKRIGRDMAAKAGREEMDQDDYDVWLVGHMQKVRSLRQQLAELDVPEPPSKTADEVHAEWENGDLAVRRAFVQQAFPRLTIRPANYRGRNGDAGARIDWSGDSLPG